jgi:hypothetical protein
MINIGLDIFTVYSNLYLLSFVELVVILKDSFNAMEISVLQFEVIVSYTTC